MKNGGERREKTKRSKQSEIVICANSCVEELQFLRNKNHRSNTKSDNKEHKNKKYTQKATIFTIKKLLLYLLYFNSKMG